MPYPLTVRRDTLTVMRRKFILRTGCVFVCAAASLTVLHSQQPQVVAHVLDVKGEWHIEGTPEPIAAGRGLFAGAKVAAGSNRQGDAITIVRDEDMSRTRVACDGTAVNPCQKPIVIQNSSSDIAVGHSQLKNIVQAAISVLLSRPPAIVNHYALTLSRGEGTVVESEAVIALDPTQGLVLPPAPEEMPAGTYTVSSSRVGQTASPTARDALLASDGTWRPLPWEESGLYEVSILSGDGQQISDMMLLVTSADRYSALKEKFDGLKNRTQTWTGPNARSDEHLFLRAFMLTESQP